MELLKIDFVHKSEQLKIFKPCLENSRGSTEFPNLTLIQISKEVLKL